ncbi:hypothetical protein C8T65DRAFT_744402 [Cerioporus squamosus]|nr:hypothetical protein C8T65DRAFT_744402 [Cerioporus squamosus]
MSTVFLHQSPRPQQLTTFSTLHGAVDLSRVGYNGKENRNPNATQLYPIPTAQLHPSLTQPATVWDRKVCVTFESAFPHHGGWRFADIRAARKRDLLIADSPAFPDSRGSSFDLRITWPGYAHLKDDYRRINVIKAGRLVSRFELAADIVKAFEWFFEKARRSAHGTDPFWRISSNTSVDDMVLVSLENIDHNPCVFQAVVNVVPRR